MTIIEIAVSLREQLKTERKISWDQLQCGRGGMKPICFTFLHLRQGIFSRCHYDMFAALQVVKFEFIRDRVIQQNFCEFLFPEIFNAVQLQTIHQLVKWIVGRSEHGPGSFVQIVVQFRKLQCFAKNCKILRVACDFGDALAFWIGSQVSFDETRVKWKAIRRATECLWASEWYRNASKHRDRSI